MLRIMDAMTPVRRGSSQLPCVFMERQWLVLNHFGWEISPLQTSHERDGLAIGTG
jgi:hypothetical protein